MKKKQLIEAHGDFTVAAYAICTGPFDSGVVIPFSSMDDCLKATSTNSYSFAHGGNWSVCDTKDITTFVVKLSRAGRLDIKSVLDTVFNTPPVSSEEFAQLALLAAQYSTKNDAEFISHHSDNVIHINFAEYPVDYDDEEEDIDLEESYMGESDSPHVVECYVYYYGDGEMTVIPFADYDLADNLVDAVPYDDPIDWEICYPKDINNIIVEYCRDSDLNIKTVLEKLHTLPSVTREIFDNAKAAHDAKFSPQTEGDEIFYVADEYGFSINIWEHSSPNNEDENDIELEEAVISHHDAKAYAFGRGHNNYIIVPFDDITNCHTIVSHSGGDYHWAVFDLDDISDNLIDFCRKNKISMLTVLERIQDAPVLDGHDFAKFEASVNSSGGVNDEYDDYDSSEDHFTDPTDSENFNMDHLIDMFDGSDMVVHIAVGDSSLRPDEIITSHLPVTCYAVSASEDDVYIGIIAFADIDFCSRSISDANRDAGYRAWELYAADRAFRDDMVATCKVMGFNPYTLFNKIHKLIPGTPELVKYGRTKTSDSNYYNDLDVLFYEIPECTLNMYRDDIEQPSNEEDFDLEESVTLTADDFIFESASVEVVYILGLEGDLILNIIPFESANDAKRLVANSMRSNIFWEVRDRHSLIDYIKEFCNGTGANLKLILDKVNSLEAIGKEQLTYFYQTIGLNRMASQVYNTSYTMDDFAREFKRTPYFAWINADTSTYRSAFRGEEEDFELEENKNMTATDRLLESLISKYLAKESYVSGDYTSDASDVIESTDGQSAACFAASCTHGDNIITIIPFVDLDACKEAVNDCPGWRFLSLNEINTWVIKFCSGTDINTKKVLEAVHRLTPVDRATFEDIKDELRSEGDYASSDEADADILDYIAHNIGAVEVSPNDPEFEVTGDEDDFELEEALELTAEDFVLPRNMSKSLAREVEPHPGDGDDDDDEFHDHESQAYIDRLRTLAGMNKV
jgi:hypothetical protein